METERSFGGPVEAFVRHVLSLFNERSTKSVEFHQFHRTLWKTGMDETICCETLGVNLNFSWLRIFNRAIPPAVADMGEDAPRLVSVVPWHLGCCCAMHV